MAKEWYWKHRGELRGPISTEDLDDLIQHHRIDNRDELRPVGSSAWLSAEAVKEMFASALSKPTEKSTMKAAARLLQQRRFHAASEGNGKSRFQGIQLADRLKSAGAILAAR
ncbi:GYF domain-containing protein [Planctomicrobium sp. SH661]|uniref:GYF domain-containing protein n=1 Tax=Planctomicrobium sp. SH661 TaxID=3448124 RepID=UPI003F5BCA21